MTCSTSSRTAGTALKRIAAMLAMLVALTVIPSVPLQAAAADYALGPVRLAGATNTSATYRPVTIQKPLGSDVTVPKIIGRVVSTLLGLSGVVGMVMFIYGGFMWMTSAGNQEKITKAKNIVIWSVIGLVIVFSAYALVNFVLEAAIEAPTIDLSD